MAKIDYNIYSYFTFNNTKYLREKIIYYFNLFPKSHYFNVEITSQNNFAKFCSYEHRFVFTQVSA